MFYKFIAIMIQVSLDTIRLFIPQTSNSISFTKLTKSKTDKCTFYIGKNVKYSKVQGMG